MWSHAAFVSSTSSGPGRCTPEDRPVEVLYPVFYRGRPRTPYKTEMLRHKTRIFVSKGVFYVLLLGLV